jgi:hypothetical protein
VWPDASTLDRFLRRARARLVLLRALEGAAAGSIIAAVASVAGSSLGIAVTLGAISVAVRVALGDTWRWGWWRGRADVARRVERRTPLGRNLIVTAAELPRIDRTYVGDIVMKRAAEVSERLDPGELFPVRRVLMAFVVATSALALSRVRGAERSVAFDRGPAAGPASVSRVSLTITPPVYSGLPAMTVNDPLRVELLAGSRLDVSVEANATSVRMETLAGSQDLSRAARSTFEGNVTVSADGFLALSPADSAGSPGARTLIGLSVQQDRPPRVSLTSPGRDLFFSAVPGSLPVAISADDDLALATVALRYTAVSGSGERFTFVEREVPVTVLRANERTWTARGTWNLAPLQLAAGDLVVYRAVATDRRPGSAPVESESYVLEVVTPGAIAAEGFAADDQRDRYAVSQQMVILKTERLLARRGSISTDSIAEASRLLAAEQRQVRAEFVFMMGGELEDLAADVAGTLEVNEVAEAEAEGDLLAGRLQNQGRVDMTRAIRAMSRASTALTEIDLDRALRDERVALDNLMRAFARSRFILRALTQRERIDLERRLSGALHLTAGLSGPAVAAEPNEGVVTLRRLLAEVAALAVGETGNANTQIVNAAMAALRANPGSDTVQGLATRAQAIARAPRPATVDSLVKEIAAVIQVAMPRSPNVGVRLELDVLAGALRDAARRRRAVP